MRSNWRSCFVSHRLSQLLRSVSLPSLSSHATDPCANTLASLIVTSFFL